MVKPKVKSSLGLMISYSQVKVFFIVAGFLGFQKQSGKAKTKVVRLNKLEQDSLNFVWLWVNVHCKESEHQYKDGF